MGLTTGAYALLYIIHYFSIKIGLSLDEVKEITEVISGLYPKYEIAESCYKTLYNIMLKDKKNQNGKINCSLLTTIGQCRIDNVCTEEELYDSLRYYSTL